MRRTLNYAILCMLLIVAGMQRAKAQCPATTPLVINSINTTESRCQSTGTATILASGGAAPYTYSIIAGPSLALPQSSNVIQSLAAGSYAVQVTDQCNTSDTGYFTIAGTYNVPDPAFTTTAPTCSASSDGAIKITVNNGRAPFTYTLTSPSSVTTGPQAGNVFNGLVSGTYTVKVSDSCGNFQTRTVSVPAASPGAISTAGIIRYLGCDSFAYIVVVALPNGPSDYRPPYTTSVSLPGGTAMSHVLNAPIGAGGSFTDTFYYRYHHISGASDPWSLTVTNSCGNSSTYNNSLQGVLDMTANGTLTGSGCTGAYTYTFDGNASGVHCGTILYTLVSPSGTVLATQPNNSTFAGYPPGNGYKVVRQDCCQKDSLSFDWASAPAFSIAGAIPFNFGSCKEGLAGLILGYANYAPRYIVLRSGPASVTFADGATHTYIYPDTIQNNYLVSGAMDIGGLTTGTYAIDAFDDCGDKYSLTATIPASALRHSTFTAAPVSGCAGANQIVMNAVSNSFLSAFFPDAAITLNSAPFTNVLSAPFTTTANNLSPGNYYVAYNYINPYARYLVYTSGTAGLNCDVITDTVVVTGYTTPVFSSLPVVAVCGTARQVALLPDSSTGAAPYQFEILTGPTTTPLQASPVFTGLTRGVYTFLMEDACGNSYSRSISIDTLAVPNLVTTGSTCPGGSATFTLPASPFYSYSWLLPNGSTKTGNKLTIYPVTNADTGTYKISVTGAIGGCTNTASKNYTLNYCMALPETLLNFSGQRQNGTIQLHWQTADEMNMAYYIVERSTDGMVFTPVQRVTATDYQANSYTATDMHVPPGVVYYRLQMVENGGEVSYSPDISFNNRNTQPFSVFPGLITGNTPVTVTCPVTSHTSYIRIIGIDGRVWRTIPIAAGVTQTRIDVSTLAKGSYFIVFTGNDKVVSTPVWKE